MRKRDMMARIEALEKRMAQLETQQPWTPPAQITWGDNSAKPVDVEWTYEGILLEDRDAYAG